MEHIKDLIDPENLPLLKPSEDLPKKTEPASNVITRLFAVLAAQYGHAWVSLIQVEETENLMRHEWSRGLAGISPDEIGKALKQLPSLHPKWPPTIGEFQALCNIGKSDLPEFKSLPRPWPTEDKADPAFDELRKILRYNP